MSEKKRRGWGWSWTKKPKPSSPEEPPAASPPPSGQAPSRSVDPRHRSASGLFLSPEADANHAKDPSLTTSKLAQLQLKRVRRASSGELVGVDPSSIRVLLAGMTPIHQILISSHLEEIGFRIEHCEKLDALPIYLARFGPPRIVLFEAEATRSVLNLFRERIYPLLRTASLPCVLVGTGTLPEQDAAWRGWFKDAFTQEQDMDEIVRKIRSITSSGR